MPRLLYAVSEEEFRNFGPAIAAACACRGLAITLATPDDPPASIDYMVVTPAGAITDFSAYTGLKAALSLWAGVERILGNASLTAPLCRMVDPGLTAGMIDYVAGNVLRYHIDIDATLAAQDGVWRSERIPPLAAERRVGFLGLGALGRACAGALAGLGFEVAGWSRRPAELLGVRCAHGPDGLDEVLAASEILVTLLPATPMTYRILNAARLARLPRGARLINPGRGSLVDEAALLAALDSGHMAHATLDVFETEPLPPAHAFWAHPGITVTPHVAAATRPASAAEVIAENIRRSEVGEPLLHRVDRTAGY